MTTNILKLIPVIQTASMLEDNIEFLDKKRKKSKDFMKQGVKNVLNVSLISATSNLISNTGVFAADVAYTGVQRNLYVGVGYSTT